MINPFQSKYKNPFIPTAGIVEEEHLLFNHERKIKQILEIINSGGSVALIGKGGMGKSTILWAVCQQAESYLEQKRKGIFLDLNLVKDEKDFYEYLCHEIGIPESRGYLLTRILRDQRFLLAIDNIGKLAYPEFTSSIRDCLRGLSEGKEAPLKLITGTEEPLTELFNNKEEKGRTICPVAEICIEESLEAWDENIISTFIKTRLAKTSVRFTEEEIKQVVQESGGNPRQLMWLCHQTYSKHMEDKDT